MKSKWYELKEKAVRFRKKGISIVKVESLLGIPRSTLSGWFKDIKLSEKQKNRLLMNRRDALAKARKKAVLWHNAQKQKRLLEAKIAAEETLKNINIKDDTFFELALAFLYLGEGSKKKIETSIGSSDPRILKIFLAGLVNIYKIDINKIKCELYLRADQNPDKIKHYWSRILNLPINNFKHISIDKRTKGTKTYPFYKGVCNLKCGNVAIQRKLVSLANLYCDKITKYRGV